MTEHSDWLKLQRETALEWALTWLTLVCFGAASLLWIVSEGGYWRGRYHDPKPHLRVYIPCAAGAGILFLFARFFTDNYYLLDPCRRRILYHFKFLSFRRIRPVLNAHQILAVAGSGKKRFGRSVTGYWEHRVEAIDFRGRRIGLTDWKIDGLETSNAETATFGGLLGCEALPCPPNQRLVVRRRRAPIRIVFKPWPIWRYPWLWFFPIVFLVMLGISQYARWATGSP
jgi:hypothetical protein